MPKLTQADATRINEAKPAFTEAFELLKPGWYQAELKEVQVGTAKSSGNTKWDWVFWQLVDTDTGEFKPGRQWWTTTFGDTEGEMGKFHATFLAFDAPTDIETDELIGDKVEIYIDVETQKEGKRAGQERNVVKAIRPVGTNGESGDAAGPDGGKGF